MVFVFYTKKFCVLCAKQQPKCRISGTLYEMDGFERLTPAMTKELVESMFNEKQKKTMEATGEVDFAYTDTRVGRFRVNAFHQR